MFQTFWHVFCPFHSFLSIIYCFNFCIDIAADKVVIKCKGTIYCNWDTWPGPVTKLPESKTKSDWTFITFFHCKIATKENFIWFDLSGSSSGEEGRLAQEARRVHRRLASRQGSPAPRGQRRKDIWSSSASSDGHVRLHPVSSLRTQVQRVGGGQAHPKVQRHQEQQTII